MNRRTFIVGITRFVSIKLILFEYCLIPVRTNAESAPLPFGDLRARCRVRASTLHERIGRLAAAGRIVKTTAGYRLAEP
jgi:hypothetical protein